MECGTCLAKGVSRDGYPGGFCWQHKKTKCGVCRKPSGGKEFCVDCDFKIQWQRDDAISDFRVVEEERRDYRKAMGREAVAAAERNFYQAGAALFQVLNFHIQRLEQHIEEEQRRILPRAV